MHLDVAFVPAEVKRWDASVCILIDELRASSTIVALMDGGATAVLPASSLAAARRLARLHGTLLAGERHVVRAPGFDLGNSPAEAAAAPDLAGRAVTLSTRNGTTVIHVLPPDASVIVGCLLNARASARTALAMARETGASIGIVCAGLRGAFSIDDAIAAGCIVERILAEAGVDDGDLATADGHGPAGTAVGAPRAALGDGAIVLTDAARAALQLWRSTPDIATVFRSSWSGHLIEKHGFDEDIAFCVRVDSTDTVPVVVRGDPLRIERLPG
jgi:2-phosphosulfolactate phosphatase